MPGSEHRPGIASIFGNSLFLAGSHGLTLLVRLIYTVVLTRQLGPELFGLYHYGLAFYLVLLPLTMLGLTGVVGRELGRNPGRAAELALDSLMLRTGAGLLLGLGALSMIGGLEPVAELRLLLQWMCLALAGRALALWAQAVFIGRERSDLWLKLESLFRPLEVVVGIVVLLQGASIATLGAVHALVWLAEGLAGLVLVLRLTPLHGLEPDLRRLCQTLRQGLPLALVLLATFWQLHGALIMLRQLGLGEAQLGQLALVLQLVAYLGVLPQAVADAAMPVVSRAVARDDGKEGELLNAWGRWGLLLGTSTGIVVASLGPWLVPLVFGGQFADAGRLAWWGVALVIPYALAQMLSQVLFARHSMMSPGLAMLAGVGISALAILSYSATPGVAGSMACLTAGLWLAVLLLCLLLSRGPRQRLLAGLLKALPASLAAVLVLWLVPASSSWLAGTLAVLSLLMVGLLSKAISVEELWGWYRAFRGRKRLQDEGQP